MNDQHLQHEDELPPLDAFEQQWVDQLAKRGADLMQSEDAFVQSVMLKADAASAADSIGQAPAVIGRIGTSFLPYAVAAALLLAACVGGYWLTQNASTTPANEIVNQTNDETQPTDGPAVPTHARPKVALGSLIANVKTTATGPANSLTTTVSEAPQTLSIENLFDLLDGSVPDLKKILEPLEPNNEQSRA